jgi:hypothetical protein
MKTAALLPLKYAVWTSSVQSPRGIGGRGACLIASSWQDGEHVDCQQGGKQKMKCPGCGENVKRGILWLGNKTSATRVLFSPAENVTWLRQFAAGTVLYSGTRVGEVEILSRGMTEKTGKSTAYHCACCELVVRDLSNMARQKNI